jgi:hypothetical protein
VAGEFHCPGFGVLSAGYYYQTGGGQLRLIFRVDFVIAKEFLYHFFVAINLLQKRAWLQANAGDGAAEFGVGGAALGDGAKHGRDDDVFGLGIMFRAVGIGELEHVPGTL